MPKSQNKVKRVFVFQTRVFASDTINYLPNDVLMLGNIQPKYFFSFIKIHDLNYQYKTKMKKQLTSSSFCIGLYTPGHNLAAP